MWLVATIWEQWTMSWPRPLCELRTLNIYALPTCKVNIRTYRRPSTLWNPKHGAKALPMATPPREGFYCTAMDVAFTGKLSFCYKIHLLKSVQGGRTINSCNNLNDFFSRLFSAISKGLMDAWNPAPTYRLGLHFLTKIFLGKHMNLVSDNSKTWKDES